jgi:hypothetical protein
VSAQNGAVTIDGRVGGIIFESKEGRLAIRAKVTVDCTGDGDIFHRAGAASDSDIDERDMLNRLRSRANLRSPARFTSSSWPVALKVELIVKSQ